MKIIMNAITETVKGAQNDNTRTAHTPKPALQINTAHKK